MDAFRVAHPAHVLTVSRGIGGGWGTWQLTTTDIDAEPTDPIPDGAREYVGTRDDSGVTIRHPAPLTDDPTPPTVVAVRSDYSAAVTTGGPGILSVAIVNQYGGTVAEIGVRGSVRIIDETPGGYCGSGALTDADAVAAATTDPDALPPCSRCGGIR